MADVFEYKPALLGGRCEVRVSADGAEMTRGRTQKGVRFADVTEARIVAVSARTASTSLVLVTPSGKFTLQLVGLIENARTDKAAEGFARAGAAIFEALARVKPQAPVAFGGGPGLRWTMFTMGVVIALLCGGLSLAAFLEKGDGSQVFPALMLGFIAFGGAGMAVSFNPFRKPPTVTPAIAAEIIRAQLPH